MARRGGELPRFLTFGDRVPAALGLVLSLMAVASVWGWLDRELQVAAALSPVLILRGQVWRLVTWPFVQDDPLTLLFGGFMMYWLGQQLAFAWSERRFLLRFFGYAAFASLATTLLSIVWAPASIAHIGVWPVANALLVSWAMLFPDQQLNLYGVLPMTGRAMAILIAGGTVLFGLFGGSRGMGAYAPHLFALAIAWLLSRGSRVRRPWQDAKQWWSDRETRRRARHLKVVRKDGQDDDRPRWMN